jgi:GEVED domain/Secretion system C-terminal sorting domain
MISKLQKLKNALLLSACLSLTVASAQVNNYTFSHSVGTYTSISGGSTLGGGATDSDVFGALPIGFSFDYNGTVYTQFGLNANGWISMGAATPSNSENPISLGSTNNVISGFGSELIGGTYVEANRTSASNQITAIKVPNMFTVGPIITGTGIPAGTNVTAVASTSITMSANASSTGSNALYTQDNGQIRYQTIGTAPNRKLVVQFSHFHKKFNYDHVMNFQIILLETTNQIDLVYNFDNAYNAGISGQVGLRGASNADYHTRSGYNAWATTTKSTSNGTSVTMAGGSEPASGTTFSFLPPSSCAGTPQTASISSDLTKVCTPATVVLTATNFAVDNNISFQWQKSNDGINFTNIASATTTTLSTSVSTKTYYQFVTTCSASALTSTSNVVLVDTFKTALCNVKTPYCSSADTSLSGQKITGINFNNVAFGNPANPYSKYTYYADTAMPISIGGSYPLSINLGSTFTVHLSAVARVYVDFNRNNIFESAERIYKSAPTTTINSTVTTNVTVPATATAGLALMRVTFIELFGTGLDSCGSYLFGETEDFIVDIQNIPCTVPTNGGTIATSNNITQVGTNIALTATGQTGITYDWQAANSASGSFSSIGAPNVSSANYTTTIAGNYFVKLNMVSPGCPASASNILPVTFTKINGDDVCNAITIAGAGLYANIPIGLATAEVNEVVPPINTTIDTAQTGWAFNNLTNTVWLKFVATTKRVKIGSNFGTGTTNFSTDNTQLALWQANVCSDLLTSSAVLLAANEDSTITNFNSIITGKTFCLTPGTTYYVQVNAGPIAAPLNKILNVYYQPLSDSIFSIVGLDTAYCTGASAIPLIGNPSNGVFTINGSPASIFNPSAVGSFTFVYTSNSACYSTTQNVNVAICSGIEQNSISNSSFIIMPNPNNGVFTINSSIEMNGSIELINELGQVVYKNQMNGQSKNINLEHLSSGMYYVKVTNGAFTFSNKLNIIK